MFPRDSGSGDWVRLFGSSSLWRGSARAWCERNKSGRRRGFVLLATAGIAVGLALSPGRVVVQVRAFALRANVAIGLLRGRQRRGRFGFNSFGFSFVNSCFSVCKSQVC